MADILDNKLHWGTNDTGRRLLDGRISILREPARIAGRGEPEWRMRNYGQDVFAGWTTTATVARAEGWTPERPVNRLVVHLIDGATNLGYHSILLDPDGETATGPLVRPSVWDRLLGEDLLGDG